MVEFLISPAWTVVAGILGTVGGLFLFLTTRPWQRWAWLLFAVSSAVRLALVVAGVRLVT